MSKKKVMNNALKGVAAAGIVLGGSGLVDASEVVTHQTYALFHIRLCDKDILVGVPDIVYCRQSFARAECIRLVLTGNESCRQRCEKGQALYSISFHILLMLKVIFVSLAYVHFNCRLEKIWVVNHVFAWERKGEA